MYINQRNIESHNVDVYIMNGNKLYYVTQCWVKYEN